MVADDSGERQVVFSSAPLVANGDPVDLTLVNDGQHVEPRNTASPVEIVRNTGAVRLTGVKVTLRLRDAQPSSATKP